MIWDFLSRRRCDGKVKIEISCVFSEFIVGLCDLCAALIRDSHFPCVQMVIAVKNMFSKWRVTARQHEVIDVNQAQSMNDTVFISESPQAGFHDGFLTSHVSKIGVDTVVPPSWNIDKTVHGLQQSNTLMMLHFRDNSGTGSHNMSETGCADSILKLSSSSSSSACCSSMSP